jgi:endonuclease G, mitochondrial
MANDKLYQGFNQHFLIDEVISACVEFPILGNNHINDVAPVDGNNASILNYMNYSVKLSASRKFPIYTASNIDGALFKKASRAKSWKKDTRAQDHQWGRELYSAPKSDFDKGHMTKREDVQWGETLGLAQMAADSTFFYSNAVPQHKDLNQEIWKSLEDYILHTETRKISLKVCVFTGPVLSENDPPFVSTVKGETILLPIVFWKVVIFPKEDGKLYRVGFMMCQNKLFRENGIIEELESATDEAELFMQFDDAATYQVNVSLIEKLTDLKLPKAIDSYKDHRSTRLVLQEIDIDPDLESFSIEQNLGFSIKNIVL